MQLGNTHIYFNFCVTIMQVSVKVMTVIHSVCISLLKKMLILSNSSLNL